MWIKRTISPALEEIRRTFPALVLTGPRQVGKTSLLERTFPDLELVSLDVGANAEMAETRPQEFLKLHPPPVVLDEVQYAPGMFRAIKTAIDEQRGTNGLFLLAGSQNFQLMEGVTESLAGRASVIPFLGLSGEEWRPVADERPVWRDFLWRGGFPALWRLTDRPDRDRWYQGYLATYLERDVRNLLNVGSLRDFERFLRACAARCGQLLNMSEIGRDVGISTTTARQWTSVLQASNQIVLLEPYYRSLGKRIVKSPKLYFTDTGLAAFLMGFSSAEALWSSAQAGAVWETYVVCQWIRWRDWQCPAATLWFWQDRSGNEVDLIVELNQQLWAIECKLTERPTPRDTRGISKLRQFYGSEKIAGAFVACTTDAPFELSADVTAQPGWRTWPLR